MFPDFHLLFKRVCLSRLKVYLCNSFFLSSTCLSDSVESSLIQSLLLPRSHTKQKCLLFNFCRAFSFISQRKEQKPIQNLAINFFSYKMLYCYISTLFSLSFVIQSQQQTKESVRSISAKFSYLLQWDQISVELYFYSFCVINKNYSCHHFHWQQQPYYMLFSNNLFT